ncbi:MAG: GatB/YqeY domain-containing protein [Candidatus Saccharimonadales bacterium]
MLEQQLEADIKAALLRGDKAMTLTLRTVKSAVLSLKVNSGKRDSGLTDDEVLTVLAKESKKRQESADYYTQGGSPERAAQELSEKAIIDAYLPKQLTESEVQGLVDAAILASPEGNMGAIIGAVRAQAGANADGGLIARLVKERLA